MKDFTVDFPVPVGVKTSLGRMPFMICTPPEPRSQPQPSAPLFACVSSIINWINYGSVASGASLAIEINLIAQNTAPPLRRIEGVYIDNSYNAITVYVLFPDTGYVVTCPANRITMKPVVTNGLRCQVFADGFTGSSAPLTRIILTEKYIENFDIDNAASTTTFPKVETIAINNNNNTGPTFAVTLPIGLAAGNLLIATAISGSNTVHTWPAGWTVVALGLTGNSGYCSLAYKTATGAEGASVTVTGGAGSAWSGMSYRISGQGGTPQITTATFFKSAANPPILNAAAGNSKYLWLAFGYGEVDTPAGGAWSGVPTIPAFGNFQNVFTNNGFGSGRNNVGVIGGDIQFEAASIDPEGGYGITGFGTANYGTMAATICISPA